MANQYTQQSQTYNHNCWKCGTKFMSNGAGARYCDKCKKTHLQKRLKCSVEFVINTGSSYQEGFPHHYKVDLAFPALKLAIEVDGKAHKSRLGKCRDQKKEAK